MASIRLKAALADNASLSGGALLDGGASVHAEATACANLFLNGLKLEAERYAYHAVMIATRTLSFFATGCVYDVSGAEHGKGPMASAVREL